MDALTWIDRRARPRPANTPDLIYEHMESQSGRLLPIIYRPFDAGDRTHWADRGAALDFLHAIGGQGRRLLDFGPGDGWPSLLLAPYAAEVVGVDAAARRVAVCRENAARLGIANARFMHVPPGDALPFPADHFDGATAATAIEQTPDPRATLREICRVLRPGGRLRIAYEALADYRGGRERDIWLQEVDGGHCRLLVYDRRIREGRVVQYALAYALSGEALRQMLWPGDHPSFTGLSAARLELSLPHLVEAQACTTLHPAGPTWVRWLREAGFRRVRGTDAGAEAAWRLFDRMPPGDRPADLAGVDAVVRPAVCAALARRRPARRNPLLTAVK